jgi:hypothetical protein
MRLLKIVKRMGLRKTEPSQIVKKLLSRIPLDITIIENH